MRIAALVESADHVCCRYRMAAFQGFFERAGHRLTIASIPKGPIGRWRLFRSLKPFDIVILQRKLFSRRELYHLRQNAAKLIFDYDDAVWLRDSYSTKGLQDARRSRRFAAVCRAADALAPGNHFLCAQAGQFFSSQKSSGREPRRIVVPTCVDETKYTLRKKVNNDGPIRLVWVGSSSTLRGLESVSKLLDSLAEVDSRLRLRILCDRPLELSKLPVEFCPWDAATESLRISECDIGISWIPDDDWSRGKCGLKVLQYMAAGLPVAANPVGAHREMIQPGSNGFLTVTPEEWKQGIARLIENPALLTEFGANARSLVERKYSVRAGAELWLDLLEAVHKSGGRA